MLTPVVGGKIVLTKTLSNEKTKSYTRCLPSSFQRFHGSHFTAKAIPGLSIQYRRDRIPL